MFVISPWPLIITDDCFVVVVVVFARGAVRIGADQRQHRPAQCAGYCGLLRTVRRHAGPYGREGAAHHGVLPVHRGGHHETFHDFPLVGHIIRVIVSGVRP